MEPEASRGRSGEKRELQREIIRRRRKFALGLLLVVLGILYFAWALYFSGRLVCLRDASAEEITRGAVFGPFYLRGEAANLYFYRVRIPPSSGPWETKVEILDSNMLVIHPQTDFILAGEAGFEPQSTYARSSVFRLRRAGYYHLRFTQVNGTYDASFASVQGDSTPPVMRFLVKTDVVRGWRLWLPLTVFGLLFLAVVLLL